VRQPTIRQRKRRGKVTFIYDINGQQFGLGTDPEAAKAKFAELLAKQSARQELGAPSPAQPRVQAQSATTVRGVLLAFVEWCKANRADATYKFYKAGIDSFDDWLCSKSKAGLLVADFGPQTVEDWIAAYASLSDNYRHNLIRSVQAAFNWAMKRKEWRRQIGENPLIGLEKPAQTPRDAYVTAEQWAKILETVTDAPFLDLLTVLKETGCRPQEAEQVESKHFDRDGRRWYFPEPVKKLRGKPETRIVHLTDRAFEICQRLALKNPTGPLFRNLKALPWKKNAINCRCKRLRDKLGFNLCVYSIRHTFCTDALTRGVDPLTVAKLMGHKDATMVMKVYNRLNCRQDHLRDALKRATSHVA
jgi:integrase